MIRNAAGATLCVIYITVLLGTVCTQSTSGGDGGQPSTFCRTVVNCFQCSQNEQTLWICSECNKPQFFLDTDVYPPVCRNCSQNLPGCLKCNNKHRCGTCRDPGFNGPVLNSPVGACAACSPHCGFCNVSGSGKCDIDHCHIGYFVNSEQTCSVCPDNCARCDDADHCTYCKPGYFKSYTGICMQCSVAFCRTCSNDGICSRCLDGSTPSITDSSCPCAPNCKSCTTSEYGICDVCNDRYKKNPVGRCIPDGASPPS